MKYAVWPTQAPPVCTARWGQGNWGDFDEKFRPPGYTGGIYDQEAYKVFYEAELEKYRKGLRGGGSPFTALDPWTE